MRRSTTLLFVLSSFAAGCGKKDHETAPSDTAPLESVALDLRIVAAAPSLGPLRQGAVVEVDGQTEEWSPTTSNGHLVFEHVTPGKRVKVRLNGPYVAQPLEIDIGASGVTQATLGVMPLGWSADQGETEKRNPWMRTELHLFFVSDRVLFRLETSGALVDKAEEQRKSDGADDLAARAGDLERRHGFGRDQSACEPDDVALHADPSVPFDELAATAEALGKTQRFRVAFSTDPQRVFVDAGAEIQKRGVLGLDASDPSALPAIAEAVEICDGVASIASTTAKRFVAPLTVRYCSTKLEAALPLKLGQARMSAAPTDATMAFRLASALDPDAKVPPSMNAPPAPRVVFDRILAAGPLGQAPFVSAIEARRPRLTKCYVSLQANNEASKAAVEMRFMVGADGRATWFKIDASDPSDAAIVDCLERALLRTSFPEATEPTRITLRLSTKPDAR